MTSHVIGFDKEKSRVTFLNLLKVTLEKENTLTLCCALNIDQIYRAL